MHILTPDPTSVMLLKILLSVLLGGLIGTERSVLAGQPAGTRTFSLVAMGATLLIIVSNYVNALYTAPGTANLLYVAAGIITGIGFIGGGVMIVRGGTVHGVTTAAGLWVASAVGIAVGYGLYGVALFTSLIAVLVFTAMWYLEERFKMYVHPTVADLSDVHDSALVPEQTPPRKRSVRAIQLPQKNDTLA